MTSPLPVRLLDPICKLKRGSDAAAGYDLVSRTTMTLAPMEIARMPVGVALGLSVHTEAQVRPRSGLTLKGVWCAFGTVDADFRGEVHVTLINLTKDNYIVQRGDRIAQLVLATIAWDPRIDVVDQLDETARGDKGWGSTGQ